MLLNLLCELTANSQVETAICLSVQAAKRRFHLLQLFSR